MTQISGEMAKAIIERAFFPLHCGADLNEFGDLIRINVATSDGVSVMKLTNIRKDEFSDPIHLGRALEQLRGLVSTTTQIDLEHWEMPTIKEIAT